MSQGDLSMSTSKDCAKDQKPKAIVDEPIDTKESEEDDTINSPHDAVFREFMQDIGIAKQFMKQHYKPEFVAQVNWESIYLTQNSYIDGYLKKYYRDVVYCAEGLDNRQLQVCFICEHQSTSQRFFSLRMLAYKVNALFGYHQQHPEADYLPIIYASVFYNGSKPYSAPLDLRDLIAAPREWVDKYLFGPPQLIDLNDFSDEELLQSLETGMMSLAMKHIHKPLDEVAKKLLPALKDFESLGKQEHISALYQYLLSAYIRDGKEVDSFINRVKNYVSDKQGEEAMTAREFLLRQGYEQGLEQGQKNIQEIAVKLLLKGDPRDLVASITGLTLEEVKQLLKAIQKS